MPTRARPQGALARVDALTAVALVRAAVKSPTVLLGVIAMTAIAGFGLADRLAQVAPDARTVFAIAVGVGLALGTAFASQAQGELEGPFGFVLVRPAQMAGLILRRAGRVLALLTAGLIALVAATRPEAWPMTAAVALPGAALGTAAGAGLGRLWRPSAVLSRTGGSIFARLGVWRARLLRAAPSVVLMLLALQARGYGAETQAQILAGASAVSAVAAVLPVDPVRLNLLAVTSQSMARLILPLAIPPFVTGLLFGAIAGFIGGLATKPVLVAALALALVGAVARVFLGLSALGRSPAAARTAGAIELLVALLLPLVGPLAMGPIAIIWILGRMIWLWRRGRRVRWLDPEGER